MVRERFKTSNNIFGNNEVEETGSELEPESDSPFNIYMLQTTRKETSPARIRDLSETTSLQPETGLFEDRLEQESPFKIIQYTEGEDPDKIAKRFLRKVKGHKPGISSKQAYNALQTREREEVDKEINQRLFNIIRDSNLVISKDPRKDLNLKNLWLQIRDDVMRGRSKTSRTSMTPQLPGVQSAASQSNAVQIARFKIVVKSFIAPIKGNIGAHFCGLKGFSAEDVLQLANAIDKQFSEDPKDDIKDHKYRIYSMRDLFVKFKADSREFVGYNASKIYTEVRMDAGPFLLHPEGTNGVITDQLYLATGRKFIKFGWEVQARLDPTSVAALKQVCNFGYQPTIIWHRIEGYIWFEVGNKMPNVVVLPGAGSKFPSHKAWVNGKVNQFFDLPQGSLELLWNQDSKNLAKVE